MSTIQPALKTGQENETALRPWIVERSRIASESGHVWKPEDHEALIDHLRQVNELAIALVRKESA